MNARHVNLALWSTAATLGLLAVVAALLGVLLPVQADVPALAAESPRAKAIAGATTAPAALPPLASFEHVWALSLRQKLTEDPAAAQAAAASQPAAEALQTPPITLIGTIGSSLAMFQSGDQTLVRGIGEQIAGAQVLAIRPSQVVVRYNGRMVTMQKVKAVGSRQ